MYTSNAPTHKAAHSPQGAATELLSPASSQAVLSSDRGVGSGESNAEPIYVSVFHDRALVQNVVIHGSRLEIGRDLANDIVVEDLLASRRHAAITLFRNQLYVEDLRSANGSLLNGQALTQRQAIGPEDKLQIGDFVLMFRRSAGPRETKPGAYDDEATQAFDLNPPDPSAPQPASQSLPPTPQSTFEETEPQTPMNDPDPVSARDRERLNQSSRAPNAAARLRPEFAPRQTIPPAKSHEVSASLSALDMVPPTALERPPLRNAHTDKAAALAEPIIHDLPTDLSAAASGPIADPASTAASPPETDPYSPTDQPIFALQPVPPTAPFFADHEMAAVPIDDAQNTFSDDDDFDPDDLPAPFSLLRNLLGEDFSQQGIQQDPIAALEIIRSRGDQVCDLSVLRRGGLLTLDPLLVGAEARALGLSRTHKFARLTPHGDILVQLLPSFRGRLRLGGQVKDLHQASQWTEQVGLLRIRPQDWQPRDFIGVDIGAETYLLRYAHPPDISATLPEAGREARARRSERLGLITSMFSSVGSHLFLMALLFVIGLLGPAQKITELEADRFVQLDVKDLELEKKPESPPPQDPEPEPQPDPEPVEQAAPEPPPKPRRQKKVRRRRRQNPAPTSNAAAAAPAKPGILAALGKIPKRSGPAGSQTLTAAVSNLDAVKVPGGGASYKVSGLIGKGPSKRLQLGGSGGGLQTKGLGSILREGGGSAGDLGKVRANKVRGRVVKASRSARTKGQGILNRAEIQKVVTKGLGQIQFCYEKELLKSQSLSGKVVFEWTIATNGRVTQVKTVNATLRSNAAIRCMISKIKTWRFPKPRGSGTVIVTYPFIFNAMGF